MTIWLLSIQAKAHRICLLCMPLQNIIIRICSVSTWFSVCPRFVGLCFFLLYGVALRTCCANCFVYTSGFLFVCCECLTDRKCFENSLLVPFFSQWVRFQKGVPRTYDFAARFKVSCGSAADPKGGKSHTFFRLDPLICCPHSVDQHAFRSVGAHFPSSGPEHTVAQKRHKSQVVTYSVEMLVEVHAQGIVEETVAVAL